MKFFNWINAKWYRQAAWYVLAFCIGFFGWGLVRADDTSIKVDSSPQAVEAAYKAVREGTAEKVVTLKDTAETMLVKLINAATATGEFIADQLPIVIRELITYYTAVQVLLVAVTVLVIGLGCLFFHVITNNYTKDGEYKPGYDGTGLRWWALVPWALGSVGLVASVVGLLKITLAPRVWLIEYAASLVK